MFLKVLGWTPGLQCDGTWRQNLSQVTSLYGQSFYDRVSALIKTTGETTPDAHGYRKKKVPCKSTRCWHFGLGFILLEQWKDLFLSFKSCSLLITEAKLYQDDKPVTIIVADAGSHIIPWYHLPMRLLPWSRFSWTQPNHPAHFC